MVITMKNILLKLILKYPFFIIFNAILVFSIAFAIAYYTPIENVILENGKLENNSTQNLINIETDVKYYEYIAIGDKLICFTSKNNSASAQVYEIKKIDNRVIIKAKIEDSNNLDLTKKLTCELHIRFNLIDKIIGVAIQPE